MVKSNLIKIKTKFNFTIIILLLLTLIHFSFPPILTFDSGHYLSYLKFLDGQAPWQQWNLVRGIIFPLFLKISNSVFGYSSQGILIFTFIFYLMFSFIYLKIIFQYAKTKQAQITAYLLFLILIVFDTIIIGYYHTILTEFVAATIMVFSFFVGLIWQKANFFDLSKNKFVFCSLYFIIFTPIAWHLKQPNVMTVLLPLAAFSIISLTKKTTLKNFIQRFSVILLSLFALQVSITIWNNFMTKQSSENYYQYTNNFTKETYGPRILPHIKERGLIQYLTENYLAAINIFQYTRKPEPELYSIEHNISLTRAAQNAIGYTIFNFNINSGPNNLQVPSKYPYQGLVNPYATLNAPTPFKSFIKSLTLKSNFIFSFSFLISPFILIGSFIMMIIKKSIKNNPIDELLFACSFIGFFQAFANIAISEILDRYLFPAYPTLLLILIIPIVNIFNKKNKWKIK